MRRDTKTYQVIRHCRLMPLGRAAGSSRLREKMSQVASSAIRWWQQGRSARPRRPGRNGLPVATNAIGLNTQGSGVFRECPNLSLVEAVEAEGLGRGGMVAAAFGDVQVAGVLEGRDDGGADRGQVGRPTSGPAGGGVFTATARSRSRASVLACRAARRAR